MYNKFNIYAVYNLFSYLALVSIWFGGYDDSIVKQWTWSGWSHKFKELWIPER